SASGGRRAAAGSAGSAGALPLRALLRAGSRLQRSEDALEGARKLVLGRIREERAAGVAQELAREQHSACRDRAVAGELRRQQAQQALAAPRGRAAQRRSA